MTPTPATDKGTHQPEGAIRPITRWALSPGFGYCLIAGEWKLIKVEPFDIRSVEYTYNIKWIQGRACAIFSVMGQDKWGQPINGNVTPAVAAAEKRRAKAPAPPREAPGVPPPAMKAATAAGEPLKAGSTGSTEPPPAAPRARKRLSLND